MNVTQIKRQVLHRGPVTRGAHGAHLEEYKLNTACDQNIAACLGKFRKTFIFIFQSTSHPLLQCLLAFNGQILTHLMPQIISFLCEDKDSLEG